ncbi:hypothetical protein DXG03_005922 [Asterophora parasitica]|uniref:Uncharacterized protein n=1 Tax=Asterophora parasitica TaxID=117018 RepID=A0A9P7G7H1_9AGAR|nr:hypothetical protein DXG03_005922 [Asterophora parasitica]
MEPQFATSSNTNSTRWSSIQALHVAPFIKISSLMAFVSSLEYLNLGKVDGMSTSNGEVKFIEDILDAAEDEMIASMMKNGDKAKVLVRFACMYIPNAALELYDKD